MNRQTLLAFAAMLVVGVLGFAAGWVAAPSAKSAAPTIVVSAGGAVEAETPARLEESTGSARTEADAADENEVRRAPGQGIERLREAMRRTPGMTSIIKALVVAAQLSAEEIPGAITLAKSAPGEMQEVILMGALARWAELDPPAAAAGTRALAKDVRRADDALEFVLAEWAGHDPAAARAWIEALPEGERDEAARGYLAGLAANDPAAAMREAATLPTGRNPGRVYESIFRVWAARDPYAATARVATLTDGQRERALSAIVGTWGKSAPDAALAWARTLPHEKERASMVRDILQMQCETDPQQAIQNVLALPEELRDTTARHLIEPLMRGGVEQARAFAESLPPGASRANALAAVAAQWARTDPAAAAAFIAAQPANPAQVQAIPDIARNWAQRDRPAAGRWVAQLPEGDARERATRQLIENWAGAEPQAAAKWIEQLPAGMSRDAAAATFASKVRGTDPAAAMEWAATVSDLTQRERSVREVLEAWRKRDRPAAQRWLETTPVIAEDLRSVLIRTP